MEVKILPNYKNYKFYSNGNITYNDNEIKIYIGGGGYKLINVKQSHYWQTQYIHRLIYEAFNGTIPKNMVIDHINNDRLDNRIDNLQLLTNKENVIKSGIKHKKVEVVGTNGENTYTFNSYYQAGQHLGVHGKTIREACEKIIKCVKCKKTAEKWTFNFKI
jgi:hypothetical protein